MAELSTIARPYAEALFRVAEGGDLNRWAGLVSELGAVAANADMRALIADPKLTHDQVYGVFAGVVKSPLDAQAQNFLRALVDNGRLDALPEIAVQFHALKNARESVADAEITSAFPMDDAQTRELTAALERKFGIKLKAHVTVDPSLIGGVRVVVGDRVLDGSVRQRLDDMRNALAA